MQYTYTELAAYLLLYSFIGWALEVAFFAVKERRFCDAQDFSVCPFVRNIGTMMDILILLLPEQGTKWLLQFSDHLDGRVRCGIFFRRDRSQNLEKAFVELRGCDTVWREEKECAPFADQGSSCDDGGAAFTILRSLSCFSMIPTIVLRIIDIVGFGLMAADLVSNSDCSQEKQEPYQS